jgi:hypothetical protein
MNIKNINNIHGLAKAGTLLLIDTGEYSDYHILGFFVVVHEFEPHKELKEFLESDSDYIINNTFNEDSFLAMLLFKGLLLEIEFKNLHLSPAEMYFNGD